MSPSEPLTPCTPCGPVGPVSPKGPLFPTGPFSPTGPWSPVGPLSPNGPVETVIIPFPKLDLMDGAKTVPGGSEIKALVISSLMGTVLTPHVNVSVRISIVLVVEPYLTSNTKESNPVPSIIK